MLLDIGPQARKLWQGGAGVAADIWHAVRMAKSLPTPAGRTSRAAEKTIPWMGQGERTTSGIIARRLHCVEFFSSLALLREY